MKPTSTTPLYSRAGFSLIEMIGVLAIMAILATIMVPNVLRSLERAAVRAEVETARNLGEQAKLYLRDFGFPPNSAASNPPTTVTSWNSQIATYASLSALDIFTNKRQMQRVYVTEPATFPALPQRALIISSMRTGVAPQTAAYIGANMTRFNDVWNWNTAAFPTVPPTGWGVWNNGNIEFLVIERINFSQVYRTDLASYTVILQNLSSTPTLRTVSFRILNPDGSTRLQNTGVPPNPTAGWQQTITLGAKERLNLYDQPGCPLASLDYTYVGGNGQKTFDYTDAQGWRAP